MRNLSPAKTKRAIAKTTSRRATHVFGVEEPDRRRYGDVLDAIERLARGETVVDPELVDQLIRQPRERSSIDELTERERQVLSLMAEGLTDRGIAEQLWLSPYATSSKNSDSPNTEAATAASKLSSPTCARKPRLRCSVRCRNCMQTFTVTAPTT